MLLLLLACQPKTETAANGCDTCGGACSQASAPATSRNHTTDPVDYPDYPPMSGDHDPCWTEWGAHSDAVTPEHWVHNLEHGGVVVVYDPSLASADLDTLTTWTATLPDGRWVLTPADTTFDGIVAAVAWEHRIVLGCTDTAALDTFFWANMGNAPEDETTEPNASCSMDSGS